MKGLNTVHKTSDSELVSTQLSTLQQQHDNRTSTDFTTIGFFSGDMFERHPSQKQRQRSASSPPTSSLIEWWLGWHAWPFGGRGGRADRQEQG